MSNTIDTTQFNETSVIQALKSKQATIESPSVEANEPTQQPTEPPSRPKRGRKPKYTTDEERIQARRLQQKQYRERRNQELAALRAMRDTLLVNH